MVKFAKWSTSCTWWEYTHLQQCISIKRERELLTHVDALISRVSEMRVEEKWSMRDIDAFAWQKSIFCISLGYSLPFSIDFVEVFLFPLQESGREIEYERDVLAIWHDKAVYFFFYSLQFILSLSLLITIYGEFLLFTRARFWASDFWGTFIYIFSDSSEMRVG